MEVYVDEIKTWIVKVYFIIKFNKINFTLNPEWNFFNFFLTIPSNMTEILRCLISGANASLSRVCVPHGVLVILLFVSVTQALNEAAK